MKSFIYGRNRSLALIFLIILITPALFYQTTLAMMDVWRVNETFTHGFLVFPITLWLIWEKREHLLRLCPKPEPFVLIITLLLSCLWLVSAIIDVKVIMQLCLISIILSLVWAILGRKIFIFLIFPLLFLYFAVPLGQGLIPPLMDFTANTTVRMIRLTGIPIYQDGLNFVLPSGSWSVAEECSGVRYLIATLTLGTVYSYLNYASLKKRLIFIAFCIFVPIFANSLRAYIIVLLGHYSGMKLAIGADHLVYGWVLFGVIIITMFYVGSFWRDSKDDFDRLAPSASNCPPNPRTTTYLASAMATVLLFQVAFYQLETSTLNATVPTTGIAELEQYGPWQRQADSATAWSPLLQNPVLTMSASYASDTGQVQLDIGYFHIQKKGSETVSSMNRLINPYGHTWKLVSSDIRNSSRFPVREASIIHANTKLLIWQWYRIGNLQTQSHYKAKLYEAYMRIFSGRTDGAYITLSTAVNGDMDAARTRLSSFFNDAIDTIEQQIEALQTAKP